MITRPLDLASRLQPPPRNFDWLFFANAGLLVLFFTLFGSRFVLAPGLGVDFQLPQVAGARAAAIGTTCHISVLRSGQIFTDDGLLTMAQLPGWLGAKAGDDKEAALLIRAAADVPSGDVYRIAGMAHRAGIAQVILAAEEPASSGGK
jgi:biopolymer transport protein ExbD